MEILVSVEQKPFYAVFVITLTPELRYKKHRSLFEDRKIFGLCRHQGLIAAVSGHSEIAGTVTVFDPATGVTSNSFQALPALDRRCKEHSSLDFNGPIWGDVHEIRSLGDAFVIVNTVADSLTVMTSDNTYSYSVDIFDFVRKAGIRGAVYGRHSCESNYYHLNSICVDRKRSVFYVMGHNTRSPDRSFIVKGAILRGNKATHGLPVLSPRAIISPLASDDGMNSGKQCHDLVLMGDHLYYSESVNSCISSLTRDRDPTKCFHNPNIGFVRGLDHSNGLLFAGSSPFRKAAGKFRDTTLVLGEPVYVPAIVCIDMATWSIASLIDFTEFCDYPELEVRSLLALDG